MFHKVRAAKIRPQILRFAVASIFALSVSPAPSFAAGASSEMQISIPSQSLASAITELSKQTGVQIISNASLLAGKQSIPVKGKLTPAQALKQLLEGSGLKATEDQSHTYTISVNADPVSTLPEVEVKGAHDKNGYSPEYAGGQVARGGRVGLLGNKDVMDTPFNITSYTSQTIADQQARTIVEILENDPSVLTTTSRLNGMDQFNIRGFAVNNSASSFGGLYGVGPYYRGSLMGVERVEVLKGASALLNGMSPTGSIGGNINLVPKRAADEPLTRFTTSYQSKSIFGEHLDFGRRFGPDNKVGVRFNAGYKDGNGVYDNQSQKLGEATLGLDYRGDELRLSLDLGYLNSKVDGTEGVMGIAAGSKVPSAPDSRTNYFQKWNYWNTEATYGSARAEWDINSNLTAYAAYGARTASEKMLFPSGNNLTSTGNFTEVSTAQKGVWNNSTAEAGAKLRFETGPVKHQTSFTVSTFSEELKFGYTPGPNIASNIYNPTAVADPGLSLPHALKTSETTLSGIAVADTLSFAEDRVQLTLGVRDQRVEKDSYNTTTGAKTSSYDKRATTPAVGIILKPWEHVSFYSNYIEALTQGPTAPLTAINKGQMFAPYKSKQYEAGVKFDLGRFATTVSVFQLKQPNAFLNSSTLIYGLDGEQRNRGLEVNTFGEVVPGVRVLGGVMFLDSELTKTLNHVNEGNTAISSPTTSVRLGGEWDTPFIPGLTLTARALYTSSQYVDNANTLEIPGWTRIDVGARYRTALGSIPTVLRANIENLADKNYWLSGNLYRGAPRTILVSATFDF